MNRARPGLPERPRSAPPRRVAGLLENRNQREWAAASGKSPRPSQAFWEVKTLPFSGYVQVVALMINSKPLAANKLLTFTAAPAWKDKRGWRTNCSRLSIFCTLLGRTMTMEWTTPAFEEIQLNCEINCYAKAEN